MSSESDVQPVDLGPDVGTWFTGAVLDGAEDANLAHHRPHRPERLAQARDVVARRTGTDATAWHLMRQVHGAAVATVDERTPAGAELRDVDVLVTRLTDRPLVVLSADCVPLVAAGEVAIGVAHAGWRGLQADAPGALVGALRALGERPERLRIALGAAIGPCCYEVGPEVVAAIAAVDAAAGATTTRTGSTSVDLRAATRTRLRQLGVTDVVDVPCVTPALAAADGADPAMASCTACGTGWFSHRRDPASGRQAALVVRRGAKV